MRFLANLFILLGTILGGCLSDDSEHLIRNRYDLVSKVITSLQNMRNIRKHKQTLSEEISTSRCILLYLQDRITKLEKVPGTDEITKIALKSLKKEISTTYESSKKVFPLLAEDFKGKLHARPLMCEYLFYSEDLEGGFTPKTRLEDAISKKTKEFTTMVNEEGKKLPSISQILQDNSASYSFGAFVKARLALISKVITHQEVTEGIDDLKLQQLKDDIANCEEKVETLLAKSSVLGETDHSSIEPMEEDHQPGPSGTNTHNTRSHSQTGSASASTSSNSEHQHHPKAKTYSHVKQPTSTDQSNKPVKLTKRQRKAARKAANAGQQPKPSNQGQQKKGQSPQKTPAKVHPKVQPPKLKK